MLKRLNNELVLNSDGWSLYKFFRNDGNAHYHLFNIVNDRTFWSTRIDLRREIEVARNGFILQQANSVIFYLGELKEGEFQNSHKVELERSLVEMRKQWHKIEKIRLKDELDAIAE